MSVLPIHDFYRFYQIQILSAVNKARQNRAFGKRNLERCDCAAPKRNGVERWDGKGEFLRVTASALSCPSVPQKEGKTVTQKIVSRGQSSRRYR